VCYPVARFLAVADGAGIYAKLIECGIASHLDFSLSAHISGYLPICLCGVSPHSLSHTARHVNDSEPIPANVRRRDSGVSRFDASRPLPFFSAALPDPFTGKDETLR